MIYYALFNSQNELVDVDICTIIKDEYGSRDVVNAEVPQELYEDYKACPDKYIAGEIEIEGKTVPYPVIDPDYEEKKLAKAKTAKYEEAKTKAYLYLESGEALYEFEEGKHIEATDGNIGKFTAYALGFMAGSTSPVVWSTKEDETVMLDAEQVTDILQGLGAVQAQVWTVKFTDYISAVQEAQTAAEVEAIEINYGN